MTGTPAPPAAAGEDAGAAAETRGRFGLRARALSRVGAAAVAAAGRVRWSADATPVEQALRLLAVCAGVLAGLGGAALAAALEAPHGGVVGPRASGTTAAAGALVLGTAVVAAGWAAWWSAVRRAAAGVAAEWRRAVGTGTAVVVGLGMGMAVAAVAGPGDPGAHAAPRPGFGALLAATLAPPVSWSGAGLALLAVPAAVAGWGAAGWRGSARTPGWGTIGGVVLVAGGCAAEMVPVPVVPSLLAGGGAAPRAPLGVAAALVGAVLATRSAVWHLSAWQARRTGRPAVLLGLRAALADRRGLAAATAPLVAAAALLAADGAAFAATRPPVSGLGWRAPSSIVLLAAVCAAVSALAGLAAVITGRAWRGRRLAAELDALGLSRLTVARAGAVEAGLATLVATVVGVFAGLALAAPRAADLGTRHAAAASVLARMRAVGWVAAADVGGCVAAGALAAALGAALAAATAGRRRRPHPAPTGAECVFGP